MLKIFKSIRKKYMMKHHPVEYGRELGCKIGNGCVFFGRPNFGSEPWLITLGNNVGVSSNVAFITHDGGIFAINKEEKYKNVLKFGKIIVHDNCFIGNGVRILPGIEIGPNSIVGLGSVVTKSVPPNSVYAGNPAKFICTIDEYKERVLKQTPEYDINEFKANKKEAVLKMLGDRLSFKD